MSLLCLKTHGKPFATFLVERLKARGAVYTIVQRGQADAFELGWAGASNTSFNGMIETTPFVSEAHQKIEGI